MKVLIIEDEIELQNEVAAYLSSQTYLCEVSSTYMDAEEKLGLYAYDIIVLDVGLPGGSGLDLLRANSLKDNPGVLILSAKDSLDDKLKGLDLGADDYLTKPFHMAELNARILALLRRKKGIVKNRLQFEDIEIDVEARELKLKEAIVPLTLKEYKLAEYFVVNKERVLSKQNLAEHLWGDDYDMVDNYDFLYVQIANLRKKVSNAGGYDYIKTIHGIGYKFTRE